jgi:two-component system response regulator AlgR
VKLRAIVVDDEELARVRLSALLKELDQVEVVGEAKNAGGRGLLPKLDPACCTRRAHARHVGGTGAAPATLDDPPADLPPPTTSTPWPLEAEAVGYLLKPVRREKPAAERARQLTRTQLGPSPPPTPARTGRAPARWLRLLKSRT